MTKNKYFLYCLHSQRRILKYLSYPNVRLEINKFNLTIIIRYSIHFNKNRHNQKNITTSKANGFLRLNKTFHNLFHFTNCSRYLLNIFSAGCCEVWSSASCSANNFSKLTDYLSGSQFFIFY